MLERPAACVLAHRAIHRLAADDVVAQREQHRARLSVANGAERRGVDAVGRRHERRLRAVVDRLPPVRDVLGERIGARVRAARWRRRSDMC